MRCWPQPCVAHVLLFFLLAGWGLYLAMWMLFRSSEAVIDGLIIKVRPNPNPKLSLTSTPTPTLALTPTPNQGQQHRRAAELHHKRISENETRVPPNSWEGMRQRMRRASAQKRSSAQSQGDQGSESEAPPGRASVWGGLLGASDLSTAGFRELVSNAMQED